VTRVGKTAELARPHSQERTRAKIPLEALSIYFPSDHHGRVVNDMLVGRPFLPGYFQWKSEVKREKRRDELSAGAEACGDGCSDPTNDISTNTPESGMERQVGWFPFSATSRCSLLVGKIEEGVRAEEGDGLKVLWCMQEESDATPSVYVWKGWLVAGV